MPHRRRGLRRKMPGRSSVPKKPTHRLEEYPPETGSDKLYVGTESLSGNGPSPVEGRPCAGKVSNGMLDLQAEYWFFASVRPPVKQGRTGPLLKWDSRHSPGLLVLISGPPVAISGPPSTVSALGKYLEHLSPTNKPRSDACFLQDRRADSALTRRPTQRPTARAK